MAKYKVTIEEITGKNQYGNDETETIYAQKVSGDTTLVTALYRLFSIITRNVTRRKTLENSNV